MIQALLNKLYGGLIVLAFWVCIAAGFIGLVGGSVLLLLQVVDFLQNGAWKASPLMDFTGPLQSEMLGFNGLVNWFLGFLNTSVALIVGGLGIAQGGSAFLGSLAENAPKETGEVFLKGLTLFQGKND